MSATDIKPDDFAYADGPGKYEDNQFRRAAAYVHDITLNGFADEEVGTVEYGPGWTGLVRVDDATLYWLRKLGFKGRSPKIAIVQEDSQGFVYVAFFTNESKARRAFDQISAIYEELDGDGDE